MTGLVSTEQGRNTEVEDRNTGEDTRMPLPPPQSPRRTNKPVAPSAGPPRRKTAA
jgi:hypothetical protein